MSAAAFAACIADGSNLPDDRDPPTDTDAGLTPPGATRGSTTVVSGADGGAAAGLDAAAAGFDAASPGPDVHAGVDARAPEVDAPAEPPRTDAPAPGNLDAPTAPSPDAPPAPNADTTPPGHDAPSSGEDAPPTTGQDAAGPCAGKAAGTPCGADRCEGATLIELLCDGAGGCQPRETACRNHGQCVSGKCLDGE